MNKANLKVRLAIMEHSLTQWEVAKILGVSETTFYRLMRDELPEEKQDDIINAISEEVNRHDK